MNRVQSVQGSSDCRLIGSSHSTASDAPLHSIWSCKTLTWLKGPSWSFAWQPAGVPAATANAGFLTEQETVRHLPDLSPLWPYLATMPCKRPSFLILWLHKSLRRTYWSVQRVQRFHCTYADLSIGLSSGSLNPGASLTAFPQLFFHLSEAFSWIPSPSGVVRWLPIRPYFFGQTSIPLTVMEDSKSFTPPVAVLDDEKSSAEKASLAPEKHSDDQERSAGNEQDKESKNSSSESGTEVEVAQTKDLEANLSESLSVPNDAKGESNTDKTIEPSLVDWDGPEDPTNPMNWPPWKVRTHIFLISAITFIRWAITTFFSLGL